MDTPSPLDPGGLLGFLGFGSHADYESVSSLFPKIAAAAAKADLEHRGFEFDDGATTPLLRDLKDAWEQGLRDALPFYNDAKEKLQREMDEVTAYWEAEIPALFEDWLDLPDPAGFEGQLSDIERAKTATAVEGQLGTGGEGSQVPNKDLAGDITGLVSRASELRGATARAFSDNYVSELDPHVAGINLGVRALGVCLEAEAAIMTRARQVVTDIANESTSAFRASAPQDGGGGFVIAMVVIGAVAAVASAGIGTPAIAAAVAGVAASAGAAETLSGAFAEEEAPPRDLDGGTPNAVRDNIRAALEALNEDIRTEEQKIRAIADAFATGDYVQLTPGVNKAVDSSEVFNGEGIRMQRHAVTIICTGFLPNIASWLRQAADILPSDAHAWSRSASIGMGPMGAWPSYEHMRVAVELGLLTTSKQLNEAAAVLWFAYQQIQSADARAEEDLGWLQKKLDSGGSTTAPSLLAGAVLGAVASGDYPEST